MKLVIGIPTRNEADNISTLVTQIDDAVQSLLGASNEVFIVNADSNSEDNTIALFNNTTTMSQKVSIRNSRIGKGRNVKSLLQFAVKKGAALVLIDGDIRSFEASWLEKMIQKITAGVDFVVPCYARYEIEGNTTNHFVYPLLFAFYGTRAPRQPIAGDFGISASFAKHLLRTKWPKTSLLYGIDIFLTIEALTGDFVIAEIDLTSKIHNPSFHKMAGMFYEVASSTFSLIALQKQQGASMPPKGGASKSQKLIKGVRTIEQGIITELMRQHKLEAVTAHPEWYKQYVSPEGIQAEQWTHILNAAVITANDNNESTIAKQLTPFFMIRVMTYLTDMKQYEKFDAEAELQKQNILVRKLIAKNFHTHL